MNENAKRTTVELLRKLEERAKTVGEELTVAELRQVEGGGYVNRVGTFDLFDCRIVPIIRT